MQNNEAELERESDRLARTLALVERQLREAQKQNRLSEASLTHAHGELKIEAEQAFIDLNASQDFEALVQLSQYAQPLSARRAIHEMRLEHADMLRGMLNAPYFARIDLLYPDDAIAESIYIGRALLRDEKAFETYVYDWRSPIASVFYRYGTGPAAYDAPVGRIDCALTLKRQFEIKNGVLQYFFDSDVQVSDEYLRKLLSQNASPSMRAIVETIQREQDVAIRDMEHDLLMVQGVAGSGKTSIALHRVAYLMYEGLSNPLAAENIAILSPNSLFENYIAGVLPELGERSVLSYTFEVLLARFLPRGKIESRFERFERLCAQNERDQEIMRGDRAFLSSSAFARVLDRYADHLAHRRLNFCDIYYDGGIVATREQLKQRVLSDNPALPLGVRLKRLERFIFGQIHRRRPSRMKTLQERAHRVAAFENEVEFIARAYSIHEISAIARSVRRFTRLDCAALYARLLSDENLLRQLAGGIALPDDLGGILRRAGASMTAGRFHHEHAAAIAYLNLRLEGKGVETGIRQAVVDEAQDYDPMHYEILRLLFPNARFTVVGDIYQAIEGTAAPDLFDEIGNVLKKRSAQLIRLNKSFRCTEEILNFAAQFLSSGAEIEHFNRAGEHPAVIASPTVEAMAEAIRAELEKCHDQGFQSIALITKTALDARRWHERLKARTELKLIDEHEDAPRGAFILPIYLAKGLEFDAVLLLDADRAHYSAPEDKNLFYIACTRALHRLNVFYAGEPSPILTMRGEAQ